MAPPPTSGSIYEGGRPIEVRDGERLSGVNVVLPRGSVITGRVVDEFGEPVAEAFVSVMRYQFLRGRRRLLPAGRGSQTNDLGQDPSLRPGARGVLRQRLGAEHGVRPGDGW